MDSPSRQLQSTLLSSTHRAFATARPLLHHLNADSSWLLQIPRPAHAIKHNSNSRLYYNVLIDPWLAGTQSELASWFSTQWHREPCAVGSICEVDDLARRSESIAKGSHEDVGYGGANEVGTMIDAVAISHEFSDHCHAPTLLQLHPDVPVFAAAPAAKVIKSWKHFRSVSVIPNFSTSSGECGMDWRSTSLPPLPDWLGISRVVQGNGDVGDMHSALMFTFNHPPLQQRDHRLDGYLSRKQSRHDTPLSLDEEDDEDQAEAIVYTPHGIPSTTLHTHIASACPRIRTLALLHGLHDVRVRPGLRINLGAHNGLQAQRVLEAKYWVGTHDEVKPGKGVIEWLLRRREVTVNDALKEEQKGENESEEKRNVRCVELGNGESLVLE